MPSSLGPAEILVILVVALIVLGPKRLPEAGRQFGKALGEVKRWSQGVQDEIKTAMDPEPAPPPGIPQPAPQPPPPPPPPAPPLYGPPDDTPSPSLPSSPSLPPSSNGATEAAGPAPSTS